MLEDEIAEYVEAFARLFDPPILEGVAVTRLISSTQRSFAVTTSIGDYMADEVIVAVGG